MTLAGAFAFPRDAGAHEWSLTETRAQFDSRGGYTFELLFDADALLYGVAPGHLAAADSASLRALSREERGRRVEELRAFFARAVEIRFDDVLVAPAVWFSSRGETQGSAVPASSGDGLPGNRISFGGERPRGARAFTIRAPESFGTLLLSIQRDEGAPARRIVKPGMESDAIALSDRGGASRLAIIALYARLGFEHILPKGLDHILFVVGLFLLSARTSALLKQVTAFTIAHSLTLALSMYGVITLPGRVVEPLIALSIAYVAIENLVTSELKPWRPLVVFGFGLLHGLGFAGVLRELGLPRSEFLVAIVSFNVGVELGQLAVIALAFAGVGWWRRHRAYRSRVVVPASAAIALVGVFWAVQRIAG
ncbi:MAG: HupE/UreJ family protein [bacterium]